MLRGHRNLLTVLSFFISTVGAYAENQLIAYWSFESAEGNMYYDETGNGHNATVTGAGVSVGPGVKGNALVCTGNAFSTEVANSSNAMNLRRFSIESWINLSIPPSQVDQGANIFNFQSSIASGVRNGYSVHIGPRGEVDFSMSDSTGSNWLQLFSTTLVQQSKWYHIVCTYDSIMMRVYVNGNLEGSLQYAGRYPPPSNNAHIGCVPLRGGGYYARMGGKIDELAFYNYSLSPDTILAHYNKLKPNNPAAPVAYWSFDAASGNTYFDVTGHGYDAVKEGPGASLAPGIKGQALNCSGSNYEIAVANSKDNFKFTKFSIESWFYLTMNPSEIQIGAKILDYQYITSGIRNGYGVHIDEQGKIEFALSSNTGDTWEDAISTTTVQPNQWYHLVCTYDSAMVKIYLNGRLDGSLAYQGTYVAPNLDARIASQRRTDGSVVCLFNGKIDELALYNYALTPDTILSHFNTLKPPQPVDTPKVIARWTFDSTAGNTYYDVTRNGHDASVTGSGVGGSPGVKGNALACTGNAFSTEVANSRDAMNLRRFSIESWVNLSIPPSQINVGANVFNFQYLTDGVRNGYSVYISPGGRVDFGMSDFSGDSWIQLFSGTALQQSKWYHIVCTYDSSTLRIYVNGTIDGSLNYAGGYPSPGINAHIGCVPLMDGTYYVHMGGKIDELAFYNYPLSPDTVRAHYNKLKPADPVDTGKVIAHWSFDSVSYGTYFDVTGHGYNAIGIGDSIRITDGLKGKALECRGPKDNSVFNTYDIQVPNSVGNFNVKNFTIEGWIYSYVDLVNIGSFYNAREIFDYATVGMEGSGTAAGFMVGCWNDGKFYFSMSQPGTWNFLSSDSIVKPKRWYHFAARYDGAAMMIYLNGRLAATKANTSGYVTPSNAARIGCQYQITGASTGRTRVFFNGKIDELKLYNYALDSQTIKRHYNDLKPGDERPFKINFGMKITYAKPGDTIWVPIYVTNYENFAFCAAQFNLRINSSQLSLLTISKDSGLVKNWLLDWNRTATDTIPVAVAGTSDTLKYGDGEFLRCKYLVKSAAHDGDTCLIKMENIEIDEKYHLVDAMNVPGKVIIKNPAVNYGDVTGDGRVTVFDARDILSYVVGMFTLPDSINHPSFTKIVADVSGNAIISSYDAALVFQYSLGMLPDFPVMHQARLFKWAPVSENDDVAHLSIALVSNSSTDGMKFNITGDNLTGFVAAEVAVRYDAGVSNIDKGGIVTALRGANLQSKIDAENRLIKLAMTTNDDIMTADPVILATITLPPNSVANPSQAFSIDRAYVNEGQIRTNVAEGGIAGIGNNGNKPSIKSIARSVVFKDNKLFVSYSAPVKINLYSLGGKKIDPKVLPSFGNGIHCIDLGHMPSAVYIYRVVGKNSVINSGKVMVHR
jgi:hypothetical protein